jgi:V8-like Glu-specific endopeptidase
MAALPSGVNQAAVRVEITRKDRKDLAAPAGNGSVPLLVGVVKAAPAAIGKPFGKAFNHGVIEKSGDGSLVWALTVTSPGAQAIRLHLVDFSLPEDTEMFFLGPNSQAHGPYRGAGRNGSGDFWTRSIAADTGTVVLRYTGGTPEMARPKMSFVISEVGHIRGRPPRAELQSHDDWPCSDNAACVVDVNCVNSGPAAAAEDAVAKMEWIEGRSIYTCTGGLLADTDTSSQIPYFLTANHCLSSDNSSLETFFNYTTDSCNGGCPDSRVTGGTSPPASTVGATVAAKGSAGDFTLLTLDESPPAGSLFLGWNNSPIAYSDGANLYRVSNPNFGPQAYSQHEVAVSGPECTGWPRGQRIYSVDLMGATMGGSSGSPVLNSAGEVVGQLSGCCGFSCGDVCDPDSNWTVDGALAFYWDSVAALLDPQGGCSSDAECDDGQFCSGFETCSGGACQSGADPCSGGTVCNESTDSCDAAVCDNDGFCEAGEDCYNCPNDCRQKVNGSPNRRYCCDGDLPECGDSRCSESGWTCGAGGGCTSDLECDDGQFCNGVETCSGSSCLGGSDPCPGQSCDEGGDQCVSCGGNRSECASDGDCCSNKCNGGRCRGN